MRFAKFPFVQKRSRRRTLSDHTLPSPGQKHRSGYGVGSGVVGLAVGIGVGLSVGLVRSRCIGFPVLLGPNGQFFGNRCRYNGYSRKRANFCLKFGAVTPSVRPRRRPSACGQVPCVHQRHLRHWPARSALAARSAEPTSSLRQKNWAVHFEHLRLEGGFLIVNTTSN